MMNFLQTALVITSGLTSISASPVPQNNYGNKPPYFILTGDSTVAVDGGWGDGFLDFVKEPADGSNPAHSGATTVSFRNTGRWANAIEAVEQHTDEYDPIVTIQFGHNDQKEKAGISHQEFKANLVRMAEEVFDAGGLPILITSLTRRTFNESGVVENLTAERRLAIEAAEAVGTPYLDLNEASTAYVNAIGEANAHLYNYDEGDNTHLNAAGERVFGRIVVDLLLAEMRGLSQYFEEAGGISEKVEAGEFATGEE